MVPSAGRNHPGRIVALEFLALAHPGPDAEWLRRELGITVVQVTEDELVRRAGSTDARVGLVATPHADPRPAVARIGPDRLVLVLLGDEEYTDAALALHRMPAVARTFRVHSLNPLSAARYAALSGHAITDARPRMRSGPRQVASAWKSGLQRRAAIRAWRDRRAAEELPIGYTSIFARAFEAVVAPIGVDDSLFEAALGPAGSMARDAQRPTLVSFRGARGQFQRRAGVHLAARLAGADCAAVTAYWSGGGYGLAPEPFVALVLRSRFVLCPPGYACNETYRVYEALLCGALPVVVSAAISQGTFLAAHLDDVLSGPSWGSALRRLTRMSEADRRRAVGSALARTRAEYRAAAESIRAAIGTP